MTGVLTTLVLGIVLSVLSGSYHMAAIMKFFNSGEYDFLMSLVMTIGEFRYTIHLTCVYIKSKLKSNVSKSNMSLVFTFEKFMISSCFIYV